MTVDDRPESVEEAGALLGATITRCGLGSTKVNAPPKGMHSSFAHVSSVPSSELLFRLYHLRAFLRSAPQDEPLVAAPSLLAVLMKLLTISNQLATKNASHAMDMNHRDEVPPMLSNPLRKLWVENVVLCHRLGEGLSGNAKTSIYNFLRNMVTLAGMNPRTAKAAGGTRIAALDVIGGLFDDDSLAPKLASWSYDILQLCLRALRSSGNGEPTYRISAMKMACSVAKACRVAHLKAKPVEGRPEACLMIPGAMEGPAVEQAIKILRQATADKFPEVRSVAASFAGLLSPMLVLPVRKSKQGRTPDAGAQQQDITPIVNLEEVINLTLRNIDDEKAEVAAGWSEALARCICTAIEFGRQKASSDVANRDVEADQESPGPNMSADAGLQKGGRRKDGSVFMCRNLKSAILFLVRHFIRVGGELLAARAGGSFSVGGRAVRVGFSLSLMKLLRIQSSLGMIGDENGITMQETIKLVLEMAGEETQKQFLSSSSSQSVDATLFIMTEAKQTPGNALFGAKKSKADAGLVRLALGNVLRYGISEISSETAQLNILQDLIKFLAESSPTAGQPGAMNPHQLQVLLIEISHLLTTLGEAAASKVEDLVTTLKASLSHHDHGVRHEAAVACSAFTASFPEEARKLLISSVDDLKTEHAQLMSIGGSSQSNESSDPRRAFGRMFRRPKKDDKSGDVTLNHQYAVHGIALMVSIVVRDLPHVPGGLSTEHLSSVLEVAEMLVSCQLNDVVTKANPNVACTCTRAGFCVITGIMVTGPGAVGPHTKKIFELWQKSYKSLGKVGGTFAVDHDLSCVEAVLSSIVAFLSYCSELLLSVPDALSQIAVILEEILNMFMPDGRFGKERVNLASIARLESAKASLMEAFAWLPSGSFPMAADSVFKFAGQQIKSAIAGEVTCSMLPSLVNREDMLLDAKSLQRADRAGQVGGARDVEESVVTLTSEAALHGERESVLHLPGSHVRKSEEGTFRRSEILGMFSLDTDEEPPTPLHAAVGTWRKPVDVSCSSSVRLLDAAIQAFSATFGLKDGQEQQEAMEMLESLVPPFLTQLASAIGMNVALTEHASRIKPKEDNAAVANITAVLLSCLKALPLHEATHNVSISLGPPWMNKAKDLLLTLLPSSSNVVRRAAAESLALLATLGVTEDAHFLQSAVLHSLDEVMQGNQPDGKPRSLPLEPVSASRAGSMLTLACIQRTAQRVSETKMGRTRGRALSAEEVILQAEEELPTLQMMTRVLPSIVCHGFRDFFIVQTHALHAFGLLLAYSSKLEKEKLEAEDLQLLRKGIESVEENFVASWTAASAFSDAGQEGEKLASEVSFLAVLLRLMALLVPSLQHIHTEDPSVASRFSCMATIALEAHGSHPTVAIECMAFFEILTKNRQILPPLSTKIARSENPLLSCTPFIVESIKPDYPGFFLIPPWRESGGCLLSTRGLRAIMRAVKVALSAQIQIVEDDMSLVSSLFAFLEGTCSARIFPGATLHRPLAAPRASELTAVEGLALEKEVTEVLRILLHSTHVSSRTESSQILRWILFVRSLVGGSPTSSTEDEETLGRSLEDIITRADSVAARDVSAVSKNAKQVRWQLKTLAMHLATLALEELSISCSQRGVHFIDSPDFSHEVAKNDVQEAFSSGFDSPPSRLVLHLRGVISLACSTSVASVDQAQLPTLQESGVLFLSKLIACFQGVPDPEQPDSGILDQYATQILSSVKHALDDLDEMSGEAYFRRFLAGCEAIQTIVRIEMTKDPMVLKRITRPTVPLAEETPFYEFDGAYPCNPSKPNGSNSFGNKRGALLVLVGKLWTVGKLLSMHSEGDAEASTVRQLIDNETNIAVHSAAVAFDGARLLLGAGASLCGYEASANIDDDASFEGEEVEVEKVTIPGADSGYLYQNIQDIDDSVKGAITRAWAACGCFSLRSLVKSVATESTDERKQSSIVWVDKLVPLMFAGLDDAMTSLSSRCGKKASSWCGSIDDSEVAVYCLYGLRIFVEEVSSNKGQFGELWSEVEGVLDRLLETIILPALGQHFDSVETSDPEEPEKPTGLSLLTKDRQAAVVKEACELLRHVALTPSAASPSLLMAILTPLDLFQRKIIEYGRSHLEEIISACLAAATSLISHSKTEDSFVISMTQVALDVHLTEKAIPTKVTETARSLLKECLSHKALGASDRRPIAFELAKTGHWETWSIVFSIDNGSAAAGSMSILRSALLDTSNPEKQLEGLAVLRKLLQTPNSASVGRVMHEAGAEVLHFFKMFGTLASGATLSRAGQARRTTACADAMKIVLVVFQQFVSDKMEEQEFVAFLQIVFDYLIILLRFNGLPNHPPPQTGSDPALGRMTAQAILHIARTAPSAFKATLASMSEADRTVLEFAVRAEMTGYTNTSAQAPAKKKLNLQGFKK